LLAKVLGDRGQPAKAIQALRDYLRVSQDDDQQRQARIYLAKLLELVERDDEALAELEGVRLQVPGDAAIERRIRRLRKRIALREEQPDSPQLLLRRISSVEMPSELEPDTSPFPAPPDLPETTLPYRAVERIGETELALVYRAVKSGDRQSYALRFLRLPSEVPPAARAAFLRSLETVVHIQHPHLVRLIEVGESDGRPFTAGEFASSTTLDVWMRNRAVPCGAARAVSIVSQLCEALETAHGSGVLHRGITPSTVLIRKDGTALLDELGLCHALHLAAPEVATTLTSPYFGSPEAVAGSDCDERSDVYSLGAVLYFLLTNAPPFDEGGLLSFWSREEPPDPRSKNPDVPLPLAQLVQRCLQRSPAARPASAYELRHSLGLASVPAPTTAQSRR
jgi:serine/threonine-protein kinase